MDDYGFLKSVLKSSSSGVTGLASKVRNIEGSLRMPMRSVTFTKPLNDKGDAVNEASLADKKAIKIKELRNELYVDGAAVTIPIEAVEAVNAREGMKSVMVNGPWLIQRVPLILNEWTPNTILKKDEIKRVPVWVKMHHVPIVAYSDIRLSLITTQIRKPFMLDSYKSNMCLHSWGRSTYARALIEILADVDLMDSLVIAIPRCDKEGHTFATIDIEYEWTPPGCASCKIFDHASDKCPKLNKEVSNVKVSDDGFTKVKKKKVKAKKNSNKQVEGVRLTKPALNLQYRRVEKGETSKRKVSSNVNMKSVENGSSKHLDDPIKVTTTNSFSALAEDDSNTWDEDNGGTYDNVNHVANNSDSEDVDEYITMEEGTKSGTRIILGWNHDDVDVSVIDQDPQVIHTRVWIKADRKEFFALLPWCLLRDFNASLYVDDTSIGPSTLDITMREFKECVETMEVMDVKRTGLHFTWNQKPKGKNGILRKLDRILANLEFQDRFVGAHTIFKPYRISDHSPSVKPNPFKFFNVSILDKRFKDVVCEGWSSHVSGFDIFRVVKKLKGLKKPIWKMMYDKGNLHANVIRLCENLDRLQTDLDNNPSNASIREEEAAAVVAFNEAVLIEEKFLKQKAKITWLRKGDANTTYFHKMNDDVAKAFINHYEVFLGHADTTNDFYTNNLFSTRLDANEALDMVRVVSSQEVKSAMFSMGNDKSPGPDGFTTAFFKDTWDIIGLDVTKAVCEFFTNGCLLKELNHTILALIPKVNAPARVNDYRPISYRGVPRCAFKVDIQKAYDTVDWEFLRAVLIGFGFHDRMISWIMECVSTTSFSISINGSLHGFLKGKGVFVKEALDEFKDASGLNPSMPKSKAYFCNIINHTKLAILHVLPFEEDRLLVKYLGVPLVSSRLIFRDCKELIDKVQNRVNDWKNKSLSIAGRLQLIQSVLGSLYVFWASVFVLPSHVLLDIEQIMRGFLWCQGSMNKGKAKVAWEVICLPKKEGGWKRILKKKTKTKPKTTKPSTEWKRSKKTKSFEAKSQKSKLDVNKSQPRETGSESRPPMLNKENYVPWSSRLLRYAKSRPNGKLIHNSILNGPYVRKMIPEPGDAYRDITEKKAKLFNEWEMFTSNEGESIESYYHRFLKLMNDLKRNKHFSEKTASNLKFLNNLQPEWSRHVTIVHQTKDLHTADYTQLYDFLKYN
nr:hypothetical protein [Tanacetum cinerariifolium]